MRTPKDARADRGTATVPLVDTVAPREGGNRTPAPVTNVRYPGAFAKIVRQASTPSMAPTLDIGCGGLTHNCGERTKRTKTTGSQSSNRTEDQRSKRRLNVMSRPCPYVTVVRSLHPRPVPAHDDE